MLLALANWVEAAKQWFAPFVMIPAFFGSIPGMPKETALPALVVLAGGGFAFSFIFKGLGRVAMLYVTVGSIVTAYMLVKGLI